MELNIDLDGEEGWQKKSFLLYVRIHAILTVYFPQYLQTLQDMTHIKIDTEKGWKAYIKKSKNVIKELCEYAEREFQ